MDDLSRLFQSLNVGENQLPVLAELKSFFIALPAGYLRQHAPDIDFSDVFECLNTEDRNQLELTCDVLQRIFRSLSAEQIFSRYRHRFLECLNHSASLPREIVLRQLLGSLESPAVTALVGRDQELVYKCASLVGDSELSVAKEASAFVSVFALTEEGKREFFKHSFLHHLENVATKSDEVRFRLYELYILLSCHSEEYLQLCVQADLLKPVLAELSKDDVLIQLNALELLCTFATHKHTLLYLISEGVLEHMNQSVATRNENPLSKFLLTGITKFFATVARIEPRIVLQKYSAFTSYLFGTLEERDWTSAPIVIQTLGFIGETLDGKIALSEQGNQMSEALGNLGSLMRNAPSEYRVKTMESLTKLFDLQGQIESDDFLRLMESWFSQLGSKPMETIVGICKQPFPELRLPALSLLKVLSEQPWCQRAIYDQPGFLEFLMDRAIEPNQECRTAKHEILATLAKSPSAGQIFGHQVLSQIQAHYREGPYFFRSQAEVAMESGQ